MNKRICDFVNIAANRILTRKFNCDRANSTFNNAIITRSYARAYNAANVWWPWPTTMRFRNPLRKFQWRYYEQQRCSTMTVVSGNIRYMRRGVPWRRGVKRQWGDRKRRFSGLSNTLRHLRKWGQHYSYVVLFSSLPPFHWPQNRWPWNDLEWPMAILILLFFCITNSEIRTHTYCRTHLYNIFCCISWPAETCGSEPWSAEYLRSAEGLRLFRRRNVAGATSSES